ncbi:MAG: rod-binding protein [Spirochaetota bacterium]
MIRNINDYTNRLNFVEKPIANKLKQIAESVKTKDSSFQEQLNQQINQEITGKVSSANVRRHRDIKSEIAKDPYKKKLYNSSVEFESIFVKMMLTKMKKNIGKSNFISGGHAEEIFEDMLYDEYSRSMSANQKLGLAEQIYESMVSHLPDKTTEQK